jgi:hypothetical protein
MLVWRKSLLTTVVVASLPLATSCNRRVFEAVQTTCDVTIGDTVEVPFEKAADILIVIDNSASMAEEQDELAANFLNQNPDECPLQDLANIDPLLKNPSIDLYTGGGPLANCGFIQLLAAFENDFRVGVITTDVGLCDNRFPTGQAAACVRQSPGDADGTCRLTNEVCNSSLPCDNVWGFRPQRGCLQPDGPPELDGARKLIAAADLTDDDLTNDDFAQRFKDTLDNISVFGSTFERGLDAVSIFLDPGSSRGPGCQDDFESFRRPNASLVVIFLTDEEDCSHGLGNTGFDDELEGEPEEEGEACGEYRELFSAHLASNCYSSFDQLPPVSLYVDALLAADPNAKVAVIAGGLGEPNSIVPAGCLVVDGAPDGDCFESGGISNLSNPGQACGPDADHDPSDAGVDGRPCCVADPGGRYFDFATQVGKKTTDSICNASFRGTMIEIAAFIAAVDFVLLPEPPASPTAIVVTIKRAGGGPTETITPLADSADCATADGWRLEGVDKVVLCGTARPGPGDTIDVQAKGTPNQTCLDNAE